MQGDSTVADDLLTEVLPQLHEIANRELNREHRGTPLSKTELIHEVWLSNISKGGWRINDRGHFFALASLAIRRLLVDLARKRTALRRGGGESTLSIGEFDAFIEASDQDAETIVEIGILMESLEGRDPDAARVVDMHYFSGFTLEEIAMETGLTFKQVRSRWEKGLKWLKRMLASKRGNNRSLDTNATI